MNCQHKGSKFDFRSMLAGDRYMTASLHSLMHLPDSVCHEGPLWSHSFESANGDLLKLFHGSQGIDKQVCEYTLMTNVHSRSSKLKQGFSLFYAKLVFAHLTG